MRIAAFDLPTPRMMDSTAALELPDVPESLLVVGGGYIGLEMGAVYAALGSRVSVVELTDGLLPGVDRDLVRPLQKRLEQQFAAIHLSAKLLALVDKKDAIEATFEAGGKKQVQQFSRVLLSVGRRPNSDGLGLENTKVEVDPQGFVVVDPQRRTADPHILAIGDVAGQPMLAHKASHEGKVAAEALAGHAVRLPAPRHPGRRLHRSGDRLGGADRERSPAAGPPRRGRPVPLGRQRPRPSDRTHRRPDQVDHRPGKRPAARLRHRRRRGGRFDLRGRAGHRNGRLRPRPGRDDPSPSHAERNPRRRSGGLFRHRHGPLSPETAVEGGGGK